MAGDASRVIVTKAGGTFAPQTQAHHQAFPEIRAEGSTPKDAGTQLVNNLTRALDSALTEWRRGAILNAVEDVQAFVDKD